MIIKELTSIKGVNMRIVPPVNYETSFDGTNENVEIANNASIDFDTTDAFSLSFWIRPYTVTATRAIFEKRIVSGEFNGYTAIMVNNKMRLIMRATAAPSKALIIELTNPFIIYGEYNVIISYDGLGTGTSLIVTVNGVDEPYTLLENTLGVTLGMANTNPLTLGGFSPSFLRYLGRLDEFAIFNEALSPANKAIILAQGKYNTDYLSIPGLVSHFKMDTLNPLDVKGVSTATSNNMDATNIIQI